MHKSGSPKLGSHPNLGIAHQLEDTLSTGNAYATTNTQGRFSAGEKNEEIPNIFKEAMGLPQAERWRAASDGKIAILEKKCFYERTPITSVPTGQRVIGTRRVNKIKAHGSCKSHLVVQGWSQVPGINCGGTFAPVCRLQSIRMMLAIAAELDYEVVMLKVQKAFLNADMEENVFIKISPGYEIADKCGVPFVVELKKRVYGFRQSPRNWFGTIYHHLAKIGFRPILEPSGFGAQLVK